MARLGAHCLTDAEIVAVLLGTGSASFTALELAKTMLVKSEAEYGTSLGFLQRLTPAELLGVEGIGPAKAARLAAAVEVGRRLSQEKTAVKKAALTCGKEVFEYMRLEADSLEKEHFWILSMNTRNQITGKDLVSVGSLDATIVHPREVFKSSIKKNAASIILVHNHPSGDPTPSDDDLVATQRLCEAGKLLGIHVVDHVIVGRISYHSVRESHPGWFC